MSGVRDFYGGLQLGVVNIQAYEGMLVEGGRARSSAAFRGVGQIGGMNLSRRFWGALQIEEELLYVFAP